MIYTTKQLERMFRVRFTVREVLRAYPSLSPRGINTPNIATYLNNRYRLFNNELDGLYLALDFINKCTPDFSFKKRVNSYILKHAMEKPDGITFLGSVPNGVAILAARMLGYPIRSYPDYLNADIGLQYEISGGIHEPLRVKYYGGQF